ncbi:MAG TPA: serine hydrolase domain-containing protein [Bacillota bacterium]|nr:serine hydrolase domain-containing protein [Bacillota bacterium]
MFREGLGNFSESRRGMRNSAGSGSGVYPCFVETAPARGVPFRPYVNVPKDKLDREILARMYESKIVGVSAAFIKDGRVVWANGYGWADLEKGKLATPATVFRIASVSKAVTATALMQLWERGLFSLEDDIGVYLGYPVRNPRYPDVKITFRMLLTHTSGILDSGGYETALGSAPPPLLKDLLAPGGKAYSELTWGGFMPGAGFVYSNFGYGIIGALVEVISGERFDQYAAGHIFRPLGMDASYNVSDIVNFGEIAVLYETTGDGKYSPACDYFPSGARPPRKEYALPPGNYYIGPAGAVRSSVPDLAKFLIAHMNGGVYRGVRILQRRTADLMHRMQWYGYGLGGLFRYMGLGFHITDALAGRRLRGHPGEACGLLSDMYFSAGENAGVIFMTNGGCYEFLDSGFAGIEVKVINAIFDKLAGKPLPAVRTVTATVGGDGVMQREE